MAGGAAWAGSEERCMQGWTDCSDCSVSMPGAEEAEKGHNTEGFRCVSTDAAPQNIRFFQSDSVEMGITMFFLLLQLYWCPSVTSRSKLFTLLILAGVGCVRRGGAVVIAADGSWA